MKSHPFKPEMKSSIPPQSAEGIDGDIEVSRAEWATAMLNVGVPREAALTCFDEVLQDGGICRIWMALFRLQSKGRH